MQATTNSSKIRAKVRDVVYEAIKTEISDNDYMPMNFTTAQETSQ
jgi:hypothetical protein